MQSNNRKVSSPQNILAAEALAKSYGGRPVVDNVSIAVRAGEIIGLLGPNGAGKTTSFYMVVGLIAPDHGRITLNGKDITRETMPARSQLGLGYLPQEASVFRKLTVRDNVLAILETIPDLTSKDRTERLEQLIEEFNLTHLVNSMASALSGGERRRVEIARALARSPHFMLLDEPCAGIDPIIIAELQQLVLTLKRRGIGILITDHNVRETLGICDRAYILADGHIVEEGAPSHIAQSERAMRYYLGEGFRM